MDLKKVEKSNLDHLKKLVELREKSLKERIKNELAWLEVSKKHFLKQGNNAQAVSLKRKQRALILKLQKRKYELKNMLKSYEDTYNLRHKVIFNMLEWQEKFKKEKENLNLFNNKVDLIINQSLDKSNIQNVNFINFNRGINLDTTKTTQAENINDFKQIPIYRNQMKHSKYCERFPKFSSQPNLNKSDLKDNLFNHSQPNLTSKENLSKSDVSKISQRKSSELMEKLNKEILENKKLHKMSLKKQQINKSISQINNFRSKLNLIQENYDKMYSSINKLHKYNELLLSISEQKMNYPNDNITNGENTYLINLQNLKKNGIEPIVIRNNLKYEDDSKKLMETNKEIFEATIIRNNESKNKELNHHNDKELIKIKNNKTKNDSVQKNNKLTQTVLIFESNLKKLNKTESKYCQTEKVFVKKSENEENCTLKTEKPIKIFECKMCQTENCFGEIVSLIVQKDVKSIQTNLNFQSKAESIKNASKICQTEVMCEKDKKLESKICQTEINVYTKESKLIQTEILQIDSKMSQTDFYPKIDLSKNSKEKNICLFKNCKEMAKKDKQEKNLQKNKINKKYIELNFDKIYYSENLKNQNKNLPIIKYFNYLKFNFLPNLNCIYIYENKLNLMIRQGIFCEILNEDNISNLIINFLKLFFIGNKFEVNIKQTKKNLNRFQILDSNIINQGKNIRKFLLQKVDTKKNDENLTSKMIKENEVSRKDEQKLLKQKLLADQKIIEQKYFAKFSNDIKLFNEQVGKKNIDNNFQGIISKSNVLDPKLLEQKLIEQKLINSNMLLDTPNNIDKKLEEIEKEINRIEHEQLNIIQTPFYLREIPNKPPPPYFPSLVKEDIIIDDIKIDDVEVINNEINVYEILIEMISSIDENLIKVLDEYAILDHLDNLIKEKYLSSKFKISENDFRFLYDTAKEIITSFCHSHTTTREFLSNTNVLDQFKNVSKRQGNSTYLINALRQRINFLSSHMLPPKQNENESNFASSNYILMWSQKKHDTIDSMLIKDLQLEHLEWTNFKQEEKQIKDDLTEDILNYVLNDAILGIENGLNKKFKFNLSTRF